jgi:hypothetical protein
LLLRTSLSRNPLPNAQVTGKLISTAGKPKILFTTTSDPEGRVNLSFEIPAIPEGTAALIVQATAEVGANEMKFLIKKR